MLKKALIGIVLIAIAAGGLWWSGLLKDYLPPMSLFPQAQKEAEVPAPQPEAQAQAPKSDLPTAQNDASDAAIAQDSAAVDTEFQGLAQDEAGADQSINDTQGAQEF
jgi:hypothetical protein